MIVAGIVPIVTVALFAMLGALDGARDRLSARIDADESAARVTAQWRADVACAARVEIADDAKLISIWRLDGDGAPLKVRYGIAPGGELARAVEWPGTDRPMAVAPLARGAEDIEFARVGAGYRLRWRQTDDDGARKTEWRQGAFATPLAP